MRILQLRGIEIIPQPQLIHQHAVLIKPYALVRQQLELRLLILAARHLFPIAFESADELDTGQPESSSSFKKVSRLYSQCIDDMESPVQRDCYAARHRLHVGMNRVPSPERRTCISGLRVSVAGACRRVFGIR